MKYHILLITIKRDLSRSVIDAKEGDKENREPRNWNTVE
jgi:hypothetical protein